MDKFGKTKQLEQEQSCNWKSSKPDVATYSNFELSISNTTRKATPEYRPVLLEVSNIRLVNQRKKRRLDDDQD